MTGYCHETRFRNPSLINCGKEDILIPWSIARIILKILYFLNLVSLTVRFGFSVFLQLTKIPIRKIDGDILFSIWNWLTFNCKFFVKVSCGFMPQIQERELTEIISFQDKNFRYFFSVYNLMKFWHFTH